MDLLIFFDFFEECRNKRLEFPGADRIPEPLHQLLVEAQVVNGHQSSAENFIAAFEMPEVSA